MDAPELAQQVVDALNRPADPPALPAGGLVDELRMVLNRNSVENESNTPDYVLAEYLLNCLAAFAAATHDRDKWYDIKPEPGWTGPHGIAEDSGE